MNKSYRLVIFVESVLFLRCNFSVMPQVEPKRSKLAISCVQFVIFMSDWKIVHSFFLPCNCIQTVFNSSDQCFDGFLCILIADCSVDSTIRSPMQWYAMWPRMMVSASNRASSFLFVKRNENQRSDSTRWVALQYILSIYFSFSQTNCTLDFSHWVIQR